MKIIATVHPYTHLPTGTIYRGDGEYDMVTDNKQMVKDLKSEYDDKGNKVFKKTGYKKKNREGK